MSKNLTIIKIGGSLLTDKSTPYTSQNQRIIAIAQEIKKCIDSNLIEDLILIHGVGSFGHPPVLEHNLHLGFRKKEQLMPLSKTQQEVNKFRILLATELANEGIPVNLMHASSIFVSEKMQFKKHFLNTVKGFLSLGMIPLIGGDMIFDRRMGFSVGSGDRIAVFIAKKLHAKTLVFATDVKGIYKTEPKLDKNATLYNKIDLNKLDHIFKEMGDSKMNDASGLMRGKLKSLIPLKNQIKDGLEVNIISMKTQGNLISLLKNELTQFTRIIINKK